MGEVIPIETGAKKKKKLVGAVKPRVMSLPLKGKSHGKAFAEFAEKCGVTLMPWQRFCADDFLTYDSDDLFIRKTVALILSRQNGKTTMLALRILFGLFELGEMSVVAMSSKRDMAEDTFEDVCQIIERNMWLKNQVALTNQGKVGKFGNGSYVLDLKNGARYEVVAATAEGARGKTAHLLILDEGRYISEDAWNAAKPTTTAVLNAQTYIVSNAGTAFSTVLNTLKERATSYPSRTLGWYEYSAPPGAKLDDRKAWAQANPSLGHTISEATLEELRATNSADSFKMEHLCQWIESDLSPWPEGAWEACAWNDLTMAPGPYTIFGFDVANSKRSASLVAGQLLPDGRIGVGILQEWKSDSVVDDLTIAKDIKIWADKFLPKGICYDHYATASIAQRLSASGQPMIDIVGQEFHQACGELLDAMNAQKIVHASQPSLDLQIKSCGVKETDSSWRLVRRKSSGDISAPIALAMIVHKMYEPVSDAKVYS